MKQFQIRYDEVSQKTFNIHLKKINELKYTILRYKYEEVINGNVEPRDSRYVAYIKESSSNITLTYKSGSKWINIYTNMYKDYAKEPIVKHSTPKNSYSYFKRFVKFNNYLDLPVENLAQQTYFNKAYIGKRYDNCIGYDMNKAFLYACKTAVFPLELVGKNRKLKEGEVGFNPTGTPHYYPSELEFCYIFKAGKLEGMDEWVRRIEKNLREVPDRKQQWKDYETYAIGMIARHNPFIRNVIVWTSNKIITDLMDENTLYSNTDSIVSLVPREDLKIGTEIGEFKIEHTGNFALIESGYQWNYSPAKVKGLGEHKQLRLYEREGHKYDILDRLNVQIDFSKYKMYYYNTIKNILVKN